MEHDREAIGVVGGYAYRKSRGVGDVHSRHFFRDGLNFVTEEVRAVDDDHVLRPAGDCQATVVQHGQVACVEPAVLGKALSVEFGVLVIPHRNGSAGDLQAPDLPFLERLVFAVDDTKRHTRDRHSHFDKRVLIPDCFE